VPDDDLNEQKHIVHRCKYIKALCPTACLVCISTS